MLSGDSSADFLALMLHSVVQPAKPAQSGDRTGSARDNRANAFNSVDVFGKGARGRIQQGTAADRTPSIYVSFDFLQGRQGRFGSARQLRRLDREASHDPVEVQPRLYRLTGLHWSGHVPARSCIAVTSASTCPKLATNVAALSSKFAMKLLRNWLPCRACRICSPKRGGGSIAGTRQRQQYRAGTPCSQEEDATRGRLPGNETAAFLRKALGEKELGEKSEAVRRARKLARKQAIREGLLPAPPKKKPFERKPPLPDVKARVPIA